MVVGEYVCAMIVCMRRVCGCVKERERERVCVLCVSAFECMSALVQQCVCVCVLSTIKSLISITILSNLNY